MSIEVSPARAEKDKSDSFFRKKPVSYGVRVRFAPSPTGSLHIGGARTALYNYLFAKKNKGAFILRIEDTDTERSLHEFMNTILGSLNWLDLECNEGPGLFSNLNKSRTEYKIDGITVYEKGDHGPYLQSQRKDFYKRALERLTEKRKCYKCYCAPDELKERRQQAVKEGKSMGYDGRCRNLTPEQEQEFKDRGLTAACRLKTPGEGKIVFDDIVKGRIEIDLSTINDFVIMKSNGMPTYNFACVVDDIEMKISHVIRGDDHIYNTPKQILVYKALGAEEGDIPKFAHLPQVHGKDGKKLSKRTGAVSVEEYRRMGYLPDALKNCLALIGWSTEDSQQIFKGDELIDKFDISRCGISAGIFDIEKLNWMNGKYIRDMSPEELGGEYYKWLKYTDNGADEDSVPLKVIEAIKLEQEKFELLSDIPERIDFLIKDDIEYDEKSVGKRLKKEGVKEILTELLYRFEETEDFSANELEDMFRIFCEEKEIGAGKVFHPVRVAVSGRMKGPGLFEMLEFIGREKTIERIKYSLREFVN